MVALKSDARVGRQVLMLRYSTHTHTCHTAAVLKLRLAALLRRLAEPTGADRALAILDLTTTELPNAATDLDEYTHAMITDLLDTALIYGWCGLQHVEAVTAALHAVQDFASNTAWACHWLRDRNSSPATIGNLDVLPFDVRLHIADLICRVH